MKTSAILRKAGDVLRERGWCQGSEGNWPHARRVCILGAVNHARGFANSRGLYGTGDLGALVDVTGSSRLWPWNDTPGRTAAEAQMAMDAAYVLALQLEGDEPDDFEVL